ncbi:MAG: class I SAM-dependent methyltransferase [Myxococcota bacterium]
MAGYRLTGPEPWNVAWIASAHSRHLPAGCGVWQHLRMEAERTSKSASFLAGQAIHTEWESDYLNPQLDAFYDAVFRRIVAALGARSGQHVLDAGCGYGFHLLRLADHGLRVTGIDFSETALENARKNLERFQLQDRVELRQGNLLELPFEDASFDHVNCWGVLMHIPELEKALSELSRVLKPGGRIAIGENNARSLHVVAWERLLRGVKKTLGRPVHPWNWTPRGLEEWREQEGGGLMVRKMDPKFVEEFLQTRGLRLVDRFAGQFTEAYTSVPARPAKRLFYRLNQAYFRWDGPADLALGNVYVFEKENLNPTA